MASQQQVIVDNHQTDPVVWLDRLSAIYESVHNVFLSHIRLFIIPTPLYTVILLHSIVRK